ncbi:MAG: amino acid adenylation domain-containing protein, partial [Cyanobacteria bacterium J06641_5]
ARALAQQWQAAIAHVGKNPDLPVGFEYLQVPTLRGANSASFEINRLWTDSDRSSLRLTCLAQDDRLRAELHYDPETFTRDAARALAQQWQAAIAHVGKNPEVSLEGISLLGENEWLTAPIARAVSIPSSELPPPHLCAHDQFALIAQQLPHRIAVVDEGQCLTYRALERRANQLAHALQDLGAGPNIPIALFTDRSVEAIVAILAILKAGSAYLPLDPALPSDGIAYRLQDAGVSLIVTQQELLSRLPADAPPVFVLETGGLEDLDRYPATVPQSSTEPEHLAYSIYTSGSTGQPKAVTVEHRQLMAYTYGAIARMQLPPDANYASVSTLAADLGHTMLFPSLLQGGTLHLLSTERVRESQAFANYCQQHTIDCLKIVPSHLQALLQGSNPGEVLPRQRLILGGEACQWSLIDRILAQQPSCRIFNHYGPTETTVGALTYEVNAESIAATISATVPIGMPLSGVRTYLLDPQLQPVAVGVPGELYIGGPTVSRGYLNKPQLNSERFISYLCPGDRDGGSSTAGEPIRLYKTGDRARLLPDGSVEFLGRVDRQIKLHGFRIELGEIEALLTQHEAVKEAVAVVREDRPGNPVLVAYVTGTTDTALDISGLRQHLQVRLPDYTIPSLFIVLKALPLTPNGKVNLKALPAPEKVRPELSPNFVAPRTELEETVAAVWCDVLQLDVVGIHDNFFDLGGHSLLATQVLSRLQVAFDIDLPLQRLFDARTVAEIAAVIEEIVLAEVEALTDEEAEELLSDANRS